MRWCLFIVIGGGDDGGRGSGEFLRMGSYYSEWGEVGSEEEPKKWFLTLLRATDLEERIQGVRVIFVFSLFILFFLFFIFIDISEYIFACLSWKNSILNKHHLINVFSLFLKANFVEKFNSTFSRLKREQIVTFL